jgi:hypothetical protein
MPPLLTVYYFTSPLLHVSTHARHHQGAFLCLQSYMQILWYPVVHKNFKTQMVKQTSYSTGYTVVLKRAV